MSRLGIQAKELNEIKNQQNYAELVGFYNRLDREQKIGFHHKLEKLINKPVLPQRIEEHLHALNQEGYERMIIYTKLLLFS